MNDEITKLTTAFRRTPTCKDIMSRVLRGDRTIPVRSAPPAGAAFCLAALTSGFQGWILCLLAGPEEVEAFAEDLAAFGCADALLFPSFEPSFDELSAADEEALSARLNVLHTLRRGAPAGGVILASINALRQRVVSRDGLAASVFDVEVGAKVGPERLTGWLADNGFKPRPQVEYPGEYSLRGGILDVYSHGTNGPVRIEFFGDEVDSIREFDPGSQISKRRVDPTRVDPTRLITPAGFRASSDTATASLFDYLPDSAPVAQIDPDAIRDRDALFAPETVATPSGATPLSLPDVLAAAARHQVLEFCRSEEPSPDAIDLRMRQTDAFGPDVETSLAHLCRLCDEFEQVFVFCQLEAEEKRLSDLLKDFDRLAAVEKIRFLRERLNHALLVSEPSCAFVPHHQLFHRYRQRRVLQPVGAGRAIDSFLDLRAGDYVVHVQYGIARFKGVNVMTREDDDRDYLVLEFADKALLYVPGDRIELVQKYVGSGGKAPPLSSLHGKAWMNRRARVEAAIEDLAAELLDLQATRQALEGHAFPQDGEWEKQFSAEFPYEETPDQLRAIEDLMGDMCSQRPMDRLICGDVGYGKTEVAMRAAFKAVMDGKQVAVLVPTTILTQQHYKTFTERMADYPVTIEMLSRFRTPQEIKDVLTRLAEGRVDVAIGTHRLVQKDVIFKELGLVIIDEEQRFGVEHKEKLKRFRRTVDVLTLTATPIPRTLHMSLTGLRDISSLHTPPQDRMSVETRLWTFDPARIRHAILRELQREGQVFFVHNRVFDIHAVAESVATMVPEARIAIGHGQMPERELQDVMNQFMEGEVDVLVCTTIVENGVDIPNANTMIINNADHFGLAELHQLRGRVGRYKNKAHAYLIVPTTRPVTPEAGQRLQTIRDYSDLGSGFHIAIRDLEIRGAGNILGAQQSGHIAAIGYELYCSLLDNTVKRLRHEPVVRHPDVVMHLKLKALLPDSYVPSPGQKLALYRDVSHARTWADVRNIEAQLLDRFGPLPDEAANLILEAEIRVMAAALGIVSVTRVPDEIWLKAPRPEQIIPHLDDTEAPIRLIDVQTIIIKLPPGSRDPLASVKLLRNVLKKPFDAIDNERALDSASTQP